MIEDKPVMERKEINTRSLRMLAIYLTGLKDGKGNLHPLGTIVLDDLWDAIKYLQGSSMYKCSKRDEK